MRYIIEKGESGWRLRFLAPRRKDVRRLRSNIRKATSLFLVMNGCQNAFQFVTLAPTGIIHRYGDEWALSFTACLRRDARRMRKSVFRLIELLRWDGDHPCRRDEFADEDVKEHEDKCPDLHEMFC